MLGPLLGWDAPAVEGTVSDAVQKGPAGEPDRRVTRRLVGAVSMARRRPAGNYQGRTPEWPASGPVPGRALRMLVLGDAAAF